MLPLNRPCLLRSLFSPLWRLAHAILLVTLAPAAVGAQQGAGILGFAAPNGLRQLEAEERLDSMVRASNLESWMERMTREPFFVGAPFNHQNALWVAEQFRSWGYEVEIEEYEVLFPTPTVREVEMVAPHRFSASLEEPAIDEDATSGVPGRLPTYNAYSADGDVTAELVYVNQGVPADYEELERIGIDVEGKIVIARYGGSWRGIKVKVAREHGAVGVLLYSDPRDDGFFQGDAYPDGPYRAEFGVQRGAVQDMPLYPGDPLTPGVGATPDADRMSIEESPTIMRIPVLPLSWRDALPLLDALLGPVASESWRGGLPITYHVGPGPAEVRLHAEFDWGLETAYNVIARLEGSDYPDQWVIRGNHRDGWAMGAGDPISGHVAMMEEARIVGEMARLGLRPKRTMVYASWDAEEPGLLGSTEWAEHHATELREKAVAYINSDGNGRGFLSTGGSQTLQSLVNEVAQAVTDPQRGISVWKRLHARRAVEGDREPEDASDLSIQPLGSGSDYTPFLQHLGIASLDVSYGGEDGGGSYHSLYDSFDHYTRFGDPGFQYGVAQVQTTARIALRLANADILPFRFGPFAEHVETYQEEVMDLLEDTRTETETVNALIASDAYVLSADPAKTYVPPLPKGEVPYLNFAPLQNALTRLKESAEAYDNAFDAVMSTHASLSSEEYEAMATPQHRTALRELNEMLLLTERRMTSDRGLPRRPWYRHQIYAPGFYTGYGVKTLPGIREAIEERRWDEASEQTEQLSDVLVRTAEAIEEATELLGN